MTSRNGIERRFFSVAQTANILGISEKSVRRLIKKAILPASRPGGLRRVLIRSSDLDHIFLDYLVTPEEEDDG